MRPHPCGWGWARTTGPNRHARSVAAEVFEAPRRSNGARQAAAEAARDAISLSRLAASSAATL